MKPSVFPHFLTAISLIWTCAACDREAVKTASFSGPTPQTVRVSQGSDILSLDPYLYLESPTLCVLHQVFDPLTDLDANAQLRPCLAEKWESTAPTEWIFHLRQGVRFHGGQALAADDVVFSIRRALDWPLSRLRSEIQTVVGVEALNELTVRITTSVPDAILPLRLASILIMDKESSEQVIASDNEARLASEANGTGPYRIASWTKDDRCVLEANEQYWRAAPSVKRLEYLATSNDQTRMAALERGEIDVLVNIPPRMVEQAGRIAGYRIMKRPGLRLIYLGLDVGRDASPGVPGSPPNPLKDPRVRQAIAKAIDNRLIVEKIMAGNAAPADQLLPEGVVGHDPAIGLERPDLDGARALLREAGFVRGFDIRLDGPNDRYVNDSQIMQAVAQQLAQVGIRVQVNAQPKARFFTDEREGNCSFFLIGWSNTNGDGAPTFENLLHTIDVTRALGAANTSTRYSNPRVDRLAERSSSEFDPAKRAAMLQEAHRLVMADLPHIPLHFQMDLYAVSNRLKWIPRRDTQVRGVDLAWSE